MMTSSRLIAPLLVALLAAVACVASAAQSCCIDPAGKPIPIKRVPTNNKIVFAVLGDWGRVGGDLSVQKKLNESGPGYDLGPDFWCSNPAHGFAANDYDGGVDQKAAAKAMDTACKAAGCQFIMNTGDSFYECGLDDPMRWKTDFTDIYQTPNTPYLSNLNWYGVFGNHDIVANASVPAQIAYNKVNSRWFADRSYAFEVHGMNGQLRLRFGAVNTNPFVTKYGSANYKYNTSEFRAYASPANITTQLDYLTGILSASRANYDFVIGHHPVFGAVSANGYNTTKYNQGDIAPDLGRKDAHGQGSWAALLAILRQYKPSMYMNGHDHTMSLAIDVESPNPTLYLTSGAGSLPDSPCSTAAYRKNLVFSQLSNDAAAAAACGATAGPNWVKPANSTIPIPPGIVGFSIVTVTKKSMQVDIYGTDGVTADAKPVLLYSSPKMPNPKPASSAVLPPRCHC